MSTPTFAESEFTSVEEFEALLRDSEWLIVALTLPDEQGEPQETDFVVLVCPYCGATVPPLTRGYDFRDLHIRAHVADLTRAVLAGAGAGVGITLG